MNELKILLIQKEIIWEDVDANLESYGQLIKESGHKPDIIILPEMFNTGFSMNAEKNAEGMGGVTVNWMKETAKTFGSAITGSMIIGVGQEYFNRMLFVHPDGEIKHYDKRHLFRLTDEHKVFSSGKEKMIVELNGWRINLNVCYDLRFPAWSRNKNDYDVLINVASWPDSRIDHWTSLLKARAIENQSYVIGVNRVGEDENGFTYNGYSSAYDPRGKKIAQIAGIEKAVLISIDKNSLEEYKARFPFYKDMDTIRIET